MKSLSVLDSFKYFDRELGKLWLDFCISNSHRVILIDTFKCIKCICMQLKVIVFTNLII